MTCKDCIYYEIYRKNTRYCSYWNNEITLILTDSQCSKFDANEERTEV
jgi:hypothetical protein